MAEKSLPTKHEPSPVAREILASLGLPMPYTERKAGYKSDNWRWFIVRAEGVCGYIGSDRADVPVLLRKVFPEVHGYEVLEATPKTSKAPARKKRVTEEQREDLYETE